jgi:hypothetical protein
MMCSIHIDESIIHVSTIAQPSLYTFLSEKLNILLICLDNRCTMHDFQCDAHVSGHVGIKTSLVTVVL